MGASRSSTVALRTPCLTTHLIFAVKDRRTRKKSEGSSPHLLPSPGKRVGENDSFLSRPFWPCLDYSCRIVDSRNSLSLLLKHAKKIFLLFLCNSTYVLFWLPANQRESWKLDGSYFKSSDLTSTLLLGPCLSFWDINCTDIGVGQLCGLSLCVCQSFNCVRLLQPHGLYPTRLPCPWNSPSKNTRVGCHLFSPGDLPDPGIEPRSRALQANYLPSEPPGTVSSSLFFDHISPRWHVHFLSCPLSAVTTQKATRIPSGVQVFVFN